MSTIAFRADDELKIRLDYLAKRKGINLSAFIKLCIMSATNPDMNEITENGMTVAEEIELVIMQAEGGDGKVYSGVEDLMKDLND